MREYNLKNKKWIKIYRKNYRKKNKAKLKAKRREAYLKNKQKEIEQTKKWKEQNAEKVKAYARDFMREVREKEAIKYITRKQIERNYKERRKELYEKRKAEGYYRNEDYRAKKHERYRNNPDIQKIANKKYRAKKKKLDEKASNRLIHSALGKMDPSKGKTFKLSPYKQGICENNYPENGLVNKKLVTL